MTDVTRRDEAWHAAIMTAVEAGQAGHFRMDDVIETAREAGCEVSDRTITKVVAVMCQLGYIEERDRGIYVPDGPFVADMAVEVVRPPECVDP